ncbi:hypothetical protein JZ751_026039 [Albula glossodonta]|uniref:Uncharacterized protein n=1 Tax=Albula glossodonta TaxID=121402 RepID=A0A8T2MQ20_9TELE|nr:hypothetical protein JZ751_026039 [Albula glossodonta]
MLANIQRPVIDPSEVCSVMVRMSSSAVAAGCRADAWPQTADPAGHQHQAFHHVVWGEEPQNQRRRQIKDFLSYTRPVNIYPSVNPPGRTLEDVKELLKPMCREYAGTGEVVYKPLGTLKRAKVERLSSDSDSEEDELFEDDIVTPWRRKLQGKWELPFSLFSANSEKTSPSRCVEEELHAETHLGQMRLNYMDCTESNDDDDEEEEGSELTADILPAGRAVSRSLERGTSEGGGQQRAPPDVGPGLDAPSWEVFFKVDTAGLSDEGSELDSSQDSRALSPGAARSLSPPLSSGSTPFCSQPMNLTSDSLCQGDRKTPPHAPYWIGEELQRDRH